MSFTRPRKTAGFFFRVKRRQLVSLEFSPNGIARIPSFCPRLPPITPREDLQTTSDTGKVSKHYQHSRQEVATLLQSFKLQDFRQNPGPIRSSALEHDGP